MFVFLVNYEETYLLSYNKQTVGTISIKDINYCL